MASDPTDSAPGDDSTPPDSSMGVTPVVMTRGGCPPWPVPNCDGGDACWDECEHWEEFVAFGLAEADAIDNEEAHRG